MWHDGGPAPDAHIDQNLPNAVAVLGQSAMPRERLDRAPHLRLIVNIEGNFLPNIDYEECHRRNIYVTTIAPVFAAPVAEMALGMAIAAARGMVEGDAKTRAGRESLYGIDDTEDSFLLRGKTMGVIGCGNLGRELIPMLRPFRGEILVHDPWVHDHVLTQHAIAAGGTGRTVPPLQGCLHPGAYHHGKRRFARQEIFQSDAARVSGRAGQPRGDCEF